MHSQNHLRIFLTLILKDIPLDQHIVLSELNIYSEGAGVVLVDVVLDVELVVVVVAGAPATDK